MNPARAARLRAATAAGGGRRGTGCRQPARRVRDPPRRRPRTGASLRKGARGPRAGVGRGGLGELDALVLVHVGPAPAAARRRPREVVVALAAAEDEAQPAASAPAFSARARAISARAHILTGAFSMRARSVRARSRSVRRVQGARAFSARARPRVFARAHGRIFSTGPVRSGPGRAGPGRDGSDGTACCHAYRPAHCEARDVRSRALTRRAIFEVKIYFLP